MKPNKILQSEDRIALTPMIDVVFLLLVYFMLLPLQTEADLSLKLPSEAPPSESAELPNEQIIEIFPNGMIRLNGAPMDSNDDRTMAQLTRILTRLRVSAERINKDIVVRIEADPDSPHQRSLDVLNTCAKAGIEKISFATFGI